MSFTALVCLAEETPKVGEVFELTPDSFWGSWLASLDSEIFEIFGYAWDFGDGRVVTAGWPAIVFCIAGPVRGHVDGRVVTAEWPAIVMHRRAGTRSR